MRSLRTTTGAVSGASGRDSASRAAIPNRLTLLRLLLAAIVIALLAWFRFPSGPAWILPVAALLFIVAAATDALDGWLARRWDVVSPFGRVMDPFADKVLVLGTLIMLAGPSFLDQATGRLVSGLEPWMVCIVLARELLVTSIRGVYEAKGVSFGASWSGKWKMLLQSIAAPLILLVIWSGDPTSLDHGWRRWTIDLTVWVTVLVTLLSGWPYISKALAVSRAERAEPPR